MFTCILEELTMETFEPIAYDPKTTHGFGGALKRFGVEGAGEPLRVVSPFEPAGDQPKAIEALADGIEQGLRYQTLLGVTGSLYHGKDD